MFTAVVIHVTPTEPGTTPPHTGEAVRAWFLNLVRTHDPRLSAALHEGGGPPPYTVGDVVGLGPIREGRRMLSPERPGWLRVTALTEELSALLVERIAPMLPGAYLDLAGTIMRIDGVSRTPDEHPWAGAATPQAQLAAGSLREDMSRRLLIRFAAPTTFKSEGAHVPFPLPDLVFGSLLNRWNAFAPVNLHPDARRFAGVKVVASKYRLRTRYVTFAGGKHGSATGCTGICRYVVRSGDKYWLGIIRTLAMFAFFGGVGARTAMGLGQAALWDEEAWRPASIVHEQGDGI